MVGRLVSSLLLAVASGVFPLAGPSPVHAQTAPVPASERGSTLARVKARGALRCGATTTFEGFGQVDAGGRWSGFDVDLCRAIAAAIFGDAGRVDFVPLAAADRFSALQQGAVDVLNRNTTWTLSREATRDLLFAGVSYYDGQGFLVHRGLKVTSALALTSDTICVLQGTTTELNLADFFRQRGLPYQPKVFAAADEVEGAYGRGTCGVYTTDVSALYALRARQAAPDDNVILPEIISKEPLGPAVRQGDDQWFSIVRWTLMAMIDAEELGVAQANVDAMARSDDPRIKRLLGVEGNYGQALGLTVDWAYRIVKFVGNYGDVFDRNVGDRSRLKIRRGLNNLWTRGGLLYAAPIQ